MAHSPQKSLPQHMQLSHRSWGGSIPSVPYLGGNGVEWCPTSEYFGPEGWGTMGHQKQPSGIPPHFFSPHTHIHWPNSPFLYSFLCFSNPIIPWLPHSLPPLFFCPIHVHFLVPACLLCRSYAPSLLSRLMPVQAPLTLLPLSPAPRFLFYIYISDNIIWRECSKCFTCVCLE